MTTGMMRKTFAFIVLLLINQICGYITQAPPEVETIKAVCSLKRLPVFGKIYFDQVPGKNTTIYGQLLGVPTGLHGFHIHEFGDLSRGCISTGGHYNPYGMTHGGPTASVKHVGDLGNIVSDQTGKAEVHIEAEHIKLTGSTSVIGRALVIHAAEDDLGLNPQNEGSMKTGNAGSRLGCCVVGYRI